MVRSAGVGINKKDFLISLPSIPIPIPTAGVFITPELALVNNAKQQGMAALVFIAYQKELGKLIHSNQPIGRTLMSDWKFIGIPILKKRTNVPGDIF